MDGLQSLQWLLQCCVLCRSCTSKAVVPPSSQVTAEHRVSGGEVTPLRMSLSPHPNPEHGAKQTWVIFILTLPCLTHHLRRERWDRPPGDSDADRGAGDVVVGGSLWSPHLHPAAITHPAESSLPAWWRPLLVVTLRPRQPQLQAPIGLSEGRPMGRGIQLHCRDSTAVVTTAARRPAWSPALTGLVEVQRDVGAALQMLSPARLHPGRGVGTDINLVLLQGAQRGGACIVLLAQLPAHVAAGKALSRGIKQWHCVPCGPEFPLCAPDGRGVPNSPEHEDVGGAASGALGRPGAGEGARAAAPEAGEPGGGIGGTCV